jgi:putative addiction module component (TIGR02574 family)
MSLSQVLEELPAFSFEERQLLVRRVIELDDPPLSEADESLVESRLADHHANPTCSVPLETVKEHLRSRTKR